MKAAAIIFHKDSQKYNPKWISKCIDSIKNQSHKDFEVFEVDYGNSLTQLYAGSSFASTDHLKNHAEAHNWLLDNVFDFKFDCAFNINIDDAYSIQRFEKQIEWIKEGFDVISSNFYHIDEGGRLKYSAVMDDKNPEKEALKGNNIIAHPVCCYSRNFWENCTKLRPEEIPKDDFELWKRSYGKFKFKILPDFLLYYRVHSQKVSAKGVWQK